MEPFCSNSRCQWHGTMVEAGISRIVRYLEPEDNLNQQHGFPPTTVAIPTIQTEEVRRGRWWNGREALWLCEVCEEAARVSQSVAPVAPVAPVARDYTGEWAWQNNTPTLDPNPPRFNYRGPEVGWEREQPDPATVEQLRTEIRPNPEYVTTAVDLLEPAARAEAPPALTYEILQTTYERLMRDAAIPAHPLDPGFGYTIQHRRVEVDPNPERWAGRPDPESFGATIERRITAATPPRAKTPEEIREISGALDW